MSASVISSVRRRAVLIRRPLPAGEPRRVPGEGAGPQPVGIAGDEDLAGIDSADHSAAAR